ncbi:MAG: TonB-dependent receptor [Lentimicrobium sp.]|nr:TonB-dependent receptor [Lentimicrobium sp.]
MKKKLHNCYAWLSSAWHSKTLRIMRIALFLIILGFTNIYASVFSQSINIDLSLKNAPLKEAFAQIEKKTDFKFLYRSDLIDIDKTTNLEVKGRNTIENLLADLLQHTEIAFTIVNDNLVVLAPRQQHTVSGTITDAETGTSIPGVNVLIDGTTSGTVTDMAGKYSIDVPENNATLVFSFIGYQTQRIALAGRGKVDVKMVPSVGTLSEVVVIGYGSQRKKDLTGAVSVVPAKDIGSLPVPSVSDALQGRAAGVQVISSGVPGSDATIRIRGVGTINNNDPLLVIDGVPVSSGLNQLNMNDIESIQVLKDASATAIYGSRGANGVMIITTKRGKGDKSHLDFNYFYGLQKASTMVEMLDASQFASLHNEIMSNAGLGLNPAYADPEALGAGTDWLGSLFDVAPMSNYSMSYSGNSDKTNYYVSGNILNQDGIVMNTGYTRYTVQFNADTKVFDNLKFGNSLTLNHDVKTSGDYNIRNTMLALPTQSIYQEDGNYSGPVAQPMWDGDLVNPIGLAKTVDNSTKGHNLLGSVYGEYEIIDNLKFKSTFGMQANFWNSRTWAPSYHWNSSSKENSYLYEQYNNNTTWVWDNTLTYEKSIEKHNLTLLAGTSAQENMYSYMNGSIQTFASDLTQQLNNGTNQPTVGGSTSSWSLFSYMGRANYTYNNKYLFTGTIRRDGSSRFGEGNKWGIFPSASVAWRISEESFMETLDFIDDMKVRAGYGVTGNQEIGNYTFASALQTIKYNLNGTIVTAVVPTVMPNPNVQWEEQKQANIGIDASILDYRVEIALDGYIKNTEDMLVPMSVPATTGYSDVYVPSINAGKMENKGVEISINSRNITGDFTWNTTFNFSYNKNKVVSLNDTIPMTSGSIGLNYNLALIQAGYPINEFYGFETDGIFQNQAEVDNHAVQVNGSDPYNRTSAGDIRFVDQNNDGVINDKDRIFTGNPNPTFIFALNNSFAYKGFDLGIFLQGVAGNKILNANRIWSEAMSVAQNQTTETLDRWVGEGTSFEMPRAIFNDPNKNARPSNRYVEDGSYLRIKSVTLGYTLPGSLIKKVHLGSVRVYATALNLVTFTKYTGFDPEVGTSGIDNNVYPVTSTYSFGINIGF